ncbi:hypothetical protein Asal01_00172 [Fodinibius salicampi]
MGRVFSKTFDTIEKAGALEKDQFVVLTRDLSPWKSEHYFSVNKEVTGEEMEYISGDFRTRVFEGPYREAGRWYYELKVEISQSGKHPEAIYFYYTTCPKCAKYYGKNYVVGFAKMNNERVN